VIFHFRQNWPTFACDNAIWIVAFGP